MKKFFITIIGLTVFICSIACADQRAYVAVYVNGKLRDDFYPVRMDKQEIPYVQLQSFAHKFMEITLVKKGSIYTMREPGTKKIYWINSSTGQFGEQGKSTNFFVGRKGMNLYKHAWWLRYDELSRWLPVTVTWDLNKYALYVETKYLLLRDKKTLRHRLLQRQQALQKSIVTDDKTRIEPSKNFDIQARYRVNWFTEQFKNQSLDGQFSTNIDIFKGTLFGSGSVNLINNRFQYSPVYWNYTFENMPHFYLLQFGSTFYSGNLLLPAFNLKNAVNFQLRKHVDVSKGFVYQGHTMPNIEVDVWHNGIMVKILYTTADGRFNINLPNAMPGDQVKLVYYYSDGTSVEQIIHIAPDSASLLPKSKWDTNFQVGEFDDNQLLPDNHVLGHLSVRYGVTHNLTLGIQALQFPVKDDATSGGINVAWSPLETLNFLAETLSYNDGTDYGVQANYTGIKDHLLQAQTQQIQNASPIHSMAVPVFYNTLPFTNILPTAIRFWALRDTFNVKGWQVTSEYDNTESGQLLGIASIGAINNYLSVALNGGGVEPIGRDIQPFAQTTAFFHVNAKNLLVLKRNWVYGDSKTILTYRYQSLVYTGWNINVGVEQSDVSGDITFDLEMQWKITRNISTTLFANNKAVNFQLSWLGVLAMQPGPRNYEDFATGTVVGTVSAPSVNGTKNLVPVEGAVIQVGANTTQTDKNGHYYLTGLATNVPLKISIDRSSLDAALIPEEKSQMIYMRPGTAIAYNPRLSWTSGMDGMVDSKQDLPEKTKIDIIDHESKKVIKVVAVESNGFFTANKLPPGHYDLIIEHMKVAKMVSIDIGNVASWIANVHVPLSAGASDKKVIKKKIGLSEAKTYRKQVLHKELFEDNVSHHVKFEAHKEKHKHNTARLSAKRRWFGGAIQHLALLSRNLFFVYPKLGAERFVYWLYGHFYKGKAASSSH